MLKEVTDTVLRLRREVRGTLDVADQRLAEFLALPADEPFAAAVLAFDGIRRPLDASVERVSLLSAVHPEEAMRETAEELEKELVACETALSLNRDLYDRLAALDPADAPDEQAARVLEHALRDFRRSGVDRDAATRERIRALQDELVEIGQTFDRNIVKGTRRVVIAEGHAGLAGLPADYLEAHPEGADGSLTLTTDPPDYLPFMLYAERGDLRERLYREFHNRAHPQNLEVLDRMLAARHELATLLGYESWAAYITEDKMIRDADRAREFIEGVVDKARPRADVEYAELLEQKRGEQPDARAVQPWERAYLVECVKRARFDFDSQSVRPYLAYQRVQEGILATSARLYGVEFRLDPEAERWHPDVESYEVLEARDGEPGGEVIARFHLDMFPREGKYKHAAMFDLRRGIVDEVLPEAVLVCNFPRPGGDDPALLLHTQVTTFFHEFGHLLHHIFGGRQRYMRFSGTATEWDFVEVPSQLYEEWAWEPEVLATFATHFESGEPIPAELVRKLRAAEECGKGLAVLQQMLYARLNLAYYEGDPAALDTTERLRELSAALTPFEHVEGTHLQAAFGHLHGYGGIYYTYMWSLVIAKDLYGAFEGHPLDPATAQRYRREVLAPGGSRDAADLVRAFLGRDYGTGAWEAWLAR